MEKVQFDVLVENVVRVVGDGLCKKYNVAWSKGWESALYDRYESERQVIRKTMQLNPSLGEHRIDRHKIASALARSILDKSPLAAKGLAPNPGARIANELLAIGCALQVVMHFVEQILADVSLHELQKLKNRNFTFPSAHEGPIFSTWQKHSTVPAQRGLTYIWWLTFSSFLKPYCKRAGFAVRNYAPPRPSDSKTRPASYRQQMKHFIFWLPCVTLCPHRQY